MPKAVLTFHAITDVCFVLAVHTCVFLGPNRVYPLLPLVVEDQMALAGSRGGVGAGKQQTQKTTWRSGNRRAKTGQEPTSPSNTLKDLKTVSVLNN